MAIRAHEAMIYATMLAVSLAGLAKASLWASGRRCGSACPLARIQTCAIDRAHRVIRPIN